MKCDNCGIELEGKREGTRYCSPRCRKQASRKASIVTDNVTLSQPDVTDNFEFKTVQYDLNISRKDRKPTYKQREAKYWYDVPIAAIPIKKEGWPSMPDYMNGRQYFLWWKNEFKMDGDKPQILNPYPVYDNITIVQSGEGSRRWGS